jgi:hypothetical protein
MVYSTQNYCVLWGRKQIQFPKRRVTTPKNTGRWKSPKKKTE